MPRIRKAVQAATAVIWRIALYIRLSREDWKEDDRASGRKKESAREVTDLSPTLSKRRGRVSPFWGRLEGV